KTGTRIHAIAKIERRRAVDNIEEILGAADGVMIARGDLGVEMPIQEVPVIQKKIIQAATLLAKPVIIATQMLESMKSLTRPTRAEVSDVANAILDGTDATMLSEETAMGQYPVETVRMMASIAQVAEAQRHSLQAPENELRWYLKNLAERGKLTVPDVISRNAVVAAGLLNARYVITPTDTGKTAHRVSRYKPDAWILAYSRFEDTCRFLNLSYGVYPFKLEDGGGHWKEPILEHLQKNGLVEKGDRLIFAEGRARNQPGGTDTLEVVIV
ncbi:MAG: pyruvate kinase, partial [Endomicrobiales bacterium]